MTICLIALLYANKKSKFKLKSNGYTRFGWCIYMNFKRKLWWAQHKTDVYKYSTFILLILIVAISIIYFTHSKFNSSNEMIMYETTVEPFIKNDYFIASYIDGEWSNEIPGKNDGYGVDKIVCDNGAVGTWDNDKWAITIENATKKIKCSIYFKLTTVFDFDYTGTEQVFTAPKTGTYKIETWGAQGGNSSVNAYYGGYGSYSIGNIFLEENKDLYINAGGQGALRSRQAGKSGCKAGKIAGCLLFVWCRGCFADSAELGKQPFL